MRRDSRAASRQASPVTRNLRSISTAMVSYSCSRLHRRRDRRGNGKAFQPVEHRLADRVVDVGGEIRRQFRLDRVQRPGCALDDIVEQPEDALLRQPCPLAGLYEMPAEDPFQSIMAA